MNIVLIGVSGYGGYYIELFKRYRNEDISICAAIDPFAEKSDYFDWLKEQKIPVYPRLSDFYEADGKADLVIIASPIQFHREQIKESISHGSAVLCEKPVCAVTSEALELRELARKTSMPLGVGFQWSFAKPILDAKQDILDGKYGAPLCLKSYVSWKRGNDYYETSSWKGRLYDAAGNCIMDSISMNATAHYLHNILFMLGDEIGSSEYPDSIEAALFRGRNIESYDTCFLRGKFKNGCRLIYCVSHVGENYIEPKFEYVFEKGRIYFDANKDSVVYGEFSDGTVKNYGNPSTDRESFRKIEYMSRISKSKEVPVCDIETVMPHLVICETMLKNCPVTTFDADRMVTENTPPGVHISGLNSAMDVFYQTGELPDIPGFINDGMMQAAKIEKR